MKPSPEKSLGERIRELREEQDMSLREFGKKLGNLSAAFLSDVELGRRHPSEKVLADMARVLGAPLDDLKSYDMRSTVQDLKRLVNQNPAYGFAFRKMLDKKITAEDLAELVEDKKGGRKKT
jgi:transcriptional regulator with XRE-family HTH domain